MECLRNTWYMAMWAQDLPQGELVPRTILDEPLVLFRKEDGTPSALLDQCPHRFAPLHRGKLCGDHVQCGYHGLQFDVSGACVHNPHGDHRIAASLKVPAYPIVEKHTMLWVWMGDEPADPALIPDYSIFDAGSGYVISKRDHLTMEAHYQLITDNLLDLSHVSFLHDGILGNEDTIDAAIEVEQKHDTLYVTRRMPNVRPPGMFDLLFLQNGERVDTWFTMRWDVPCCLLNDAGVTRPGEPKEKGTGIFGAHILTPISETRTLYHFAAARQNPLPRSEAETQALQQKLGELRRFAFEQQDEPMINDQQKAYSRNGGMDSLVPVYLSVDAGPVRAARILKQKIEGERREVAQHALQA